MATLINDDGSEVSQESQFEIDAAGNQGLCGFCIQEDVREPGKFVGVDRAAECDSGFASTNHGSHDSESVLIQGIRNGEVRDA